MPPSRDELVEASVKALENDVSWCDDFGEQTLRETALRMSAIAVDTLSPLLEGTESTAGEGGGLRHFSREVGAEAPASLSPAGTESDEDVEAVKAVVRVFGSYDNPWFRAMEDGERYHVAGLAIEELKRRGWPLLGRVSE